VAGPDSATLLAKPASTSRTTPRVGAKRIGFIFIEIAAEYSATPRVHFLWAKSSTWEKQVLHRRFRTEAPNLFANLV